MEAEEQDRDWSEASEEKKGRKEQVKAKRSKGTMSSASVLSSDSVLVVNLNQVKELNPP